MHAELIQLEIFSKCANAVGLKIIQDLDSCTSYRLMHLIDFKSIFPALGWDSM